MTTPPTEPELELLEEEYGDDAMPVFEAKLIITVLGEDYCAADFENRVAGLSLENLAREMDEGDLIGASALAGTIAIPPGQLRRHLQAVGNDGTFFGDTPPADPTISMADCITEVRDTQGWNDGSMALMAAEFIRESGLESAFLAHLEDLAAEENACSMPGMEP